MVALATGPRAKGDDADCLLLLLAATSRCRRSALGARTRRGGGRRVVKPWPPSRFLNSSQICGRSSSDDKRPGIVHIEARVCDQHGGSHTQRRAESRGLPGIDVAGYKVALAGLVDAHARGATGLPSRGKFDACRPNHISHPLRLLAGAALMAAFRARAQIEIPREVDYPSREGVQLGQGWSTLRVAKAPGRCIDAWE